MPAENEQEPENFSTESSKEAIPNPSPINKTEEPRAEVAPPEPPKTVTHTYVAYQPEPVPPSEERTWAMLAHLSVLLNLITGFLGGIVAIIIYFVYKDKSRFVAYHAMQAFIFQAITWLGTGLASGILLVISGALSFLVIPLIYLIPAFLILLLIIPISLIYGIIGAVKVNNNEDFRYWLVGDWVRGILEPSAEEA